MEDWEVTVAEMEAERLPVGCSETMRGGWSLWNRVKCVSGSLESGNSEMGECNGALSRGWVVGDSMR